jgi:hypothetical protein
MKARWRCCSLAALAVTAILASGCNLIALPFFIFGPEPRIEPECKCLADKEHKEQVKVVILTYSGLETRPEFVRVDRELTNHLREQLKAALAYNKEDVIVANPRRIEEFCNENPNADPEEIGNHFDADYVIYLEINELTLYEKGSRNTLYRGQADITVNLIDLKHPDEGPIQKEFRCLYPGEVKNAIPREDISLAQFRHDFLAYTGKRLAWYFTSHPTNADHSCE